MLVKVPRWRISRVHAYPSCSLIEKPCGKHTQESGGDSGSPALANDIDPLEFAVTIETASEMPGDETLYRVGACCRIDDTRCQTLWDTVRRACIRRFAHASNPRTPLRGSDARHRGNVGRAGRSVTHDPSMAQRSLLHKRCGILVSYASLDRRDDLHITERRADSQGHRAHPRRAHLRRRRTFRHTAAPTCRGD